MVVRTQNQMSLKPKLLHTILVHQIAYKTEIPIGNKLMKIKRIPNQEIKEEPIILSKKGIDSLDQYILK